jgi:glycosyltransferase involved in cell wall biosynthesis
MRILLLTADYLPKPWSGIGVAVAGQARALARAGAAVAVLRIGRGEPAQRCPVNPAAFEAIHLHSLALAELALEMKRRFGRRLVYTVHSLLPLELADQAGLSRRFWTAVQAHLLRQCDFAIFLNEAERQAALVALPELAGRSAVIGHGIGPATGATAGRRQAIVLFAGRFTANKGLPLLAEMAAPLLAGRRCRLLLVGAHGDAAGERVVRWLARQHPEQVEVIPWLDHDSLQALLGRVALVVLPSVYEPFGLVALEAMRAGTPLLAAATGGLAETVRPGSGGRLVARRDAKLWAGEAAALLEAPAERAALGRLGPAYVADCFDEGRWARRLLAEAYG